MFEEPPHARECDVAERLDDLLPALAVASEAAPRAQPEPRGFELPARIWLAMIACYALFLTALAAALGSSGKAALSIAVAAVYVAVFFGAARAVLRQKPAAGQSPLDRTGVLPTLYGPMHRTAVHAQILVVPCAVALFGIAVAAIIVASGHFA